MSTGITRGGIWGDYDIWVQETRKRGSTKEEPMEPKVIMGKNHVGVANPSKAGYKGIVLMTWSDVTIIIKAIDSGRNTPGDWTWYDLGEYSASKGYTFVVISRHDFYALGLQPENEFGIVCP